MAIARNFLVEQVQENFIAYVNTNVILDRDWATQCLKAIEGHGIAPTGGSVLYEGNNFIKKAIARVTQSENTFFYIIGQFLDGYFQAKTLLKYKIRIRPRKILTFTDNFWPLSIAGTVIWASRIMGMTGWAIGKLKFCNVKKSAPKRYLAKFSSNDDELYCLNPSLRVFLRTNDVLIVDIVNGSIQTIQNYQGKILAAAMRKSIFFQQLFGSFIQSRILTRVNLKGHQA